MIFHITTDEAWQKALEGNSYRGDTLQTDGFIHCSRSEQILNTANTFFAGKTGLVLLCIDESRVRNEIRYEDCYHAGETFPHIYGPLNLDAVTQTAAFPPDADGTFSFPEILKGLCP